MQKTAGHITADHVLLTGPIRGTVTTDDGTTYDVTEHVLPVGEDGIAPEHVDEVAHLIGLRYAAEGHALHEPGDAFVYVTPEGLKLSAGEPGEMDMLYSTTSANQALDAQSGGTTNVLAYVSCHTGAPGGTGANEYAGVTRQACTWNAASSRSKTNSSALTFTTSGASAVTNFGTWSAVTAGTYGIDLPLASSVTATTITVAAGALALAA